MDQEILSAIFDSIHEGILTTNTYGEILFCSKSSEQLLHSNTKELSKKNVFDLLEIEDKREVKRNFQLLIKKQLDSYRFISTIKNAEGHELIHVAIKPHFDQQGQKALFILTPSSAQGTDHLSIPTNKKYRVDAQLIFEDDKVTFVSPSITELLGYDEHEIDSLQAWNELIHSEEVESYLNSLDRDRKSNSSTSSFSHRIRHKNGEYISIETSIRREYRKNGKMVEIASLSEIPIQENSEQLTGIQADLVARIFDANPDLIFVRDGKGKMIYCNKAVAELAGKSKAELLSPETSAFPAADMQENSYEEMEQMVISSGEEICFEEQIPDSQGITNYYQTIKKPLVFRGGEVMVLNISTNINKIKIEEKEIRNVLKVRNDYFSAMSHEIRTPMNAILGMAELLLRRRPRKDQTKLLKTLHFSSNNLLSLINDILDFSKIESGKIQIEQVNFNIRDLLANVIESQRSRGEDKNLILESNVASEVPVVVNGDYIKLSQILNNLLSNAIKFTNSGGIQIDIHLDSHTKTGHELKFAVNDTGIGIAEDNLKNIFDPFHQANKSTTREYGGTGLGLSIVKNLVEIQKGSVEVESEEGVGTVFRVTLPFENADQALPVNNLAESDVSDYDSKINLNVLYVEDVTTNQYLVEEILGEWGVRVDMASDGYKALEIVKNKDFDLILMDIQMPGIDGLETTRRIRAMDDPYFKEVPIIALTASTTDSMKTEIIKSGMQDFILKPLRVPDMRDKIMKYSGETRSLGELKLEKVGTPVKKKRNSKIDFDQTDALFQGNFVRYQRFLIMTIDEFKVNLELLNATIWDDELTAYRKLRHRMRSMLATLGMDELLKLLDTIRDDMFVGELSKKQKKEYTESLKKHVTFLIDSLTNKLASLKWE